MRRWFDRARLRIRSLTHGASADAALRRELQVHLDEQIDENIAAGMSPADARAAALRAFGPAARIEEECRDARRTAFVQNLARDLRYTLRTLLREPLLVAAAALSIGVATAANTVVVTLASELLMAVPDARAPRELAYIRMENASHVSYPNWRDLDRSGALAGLAGYQIEVEVNWRGTDRAVSIMPLIVTPNFFDLIGVPVAMGRGFSRQEAETNPDVAVLSHAFWQNRLGGDPMVVGRSMTFNGRPYTVLGVLPSKLRAVPGLGIAPEVYLPVSRHLMPGLDDRRSSAVMLIGRLRPGQRHSDGAAALTTAAERIDAGDGTGRLGRVQRFAAAGTLEQSRSIAFSQIPIFVGVLWIAVGLVLAIACANVAGLLLSRGTARRREVAVRAALGATRGRLVQQFLAESFWLALAGTIAGIAAAQLLIRGLSRLRLPVPLPLEVHGTIDLRLLIVSAAVLGVTTVLCGLVPALRSTRPSLSPALRLDERRYGRRITLRTVLVVGQVAVALVLLLTAFVFLRNLVHAQRLDPGFDAEHSVVAQVSFVEGVHTRETRELFLADAVRRLRALPSVRTATYSHGVPLTMRSGMTTGTEIRRTDRQDEFRAEYHANFVGPAYFDSLGVPLIRGREFLPDDRPGAPPVAIVNEEFVRRYFGDDDPIGRRLMLPGMSAAYAVEIVGIAGNSKYRTLGEAQQPAIFESYLQRANRGRLVHVIVSARGNAADVVRDVEQTLLALDPSAAVEVTPMRSALAFAFLPSQIGATLFGALGALGLALSMVGLYATMSYAVSRRTAEIGIRMAIGASARAVMAMVLRDAAVFAGSGIAIGLAAALFLTQPLSLFLVAGLRTSDPGIFAGTAALLLAISLAAAASPARRAMRIDPVTALRRE